MAEQELARLVTVLDARIDQFERKVQRAEARLRRGADGMTRQTKRVEGAFDSAAAGAARLVAAVVSIESVRRSISAIARSGEELRTLEARFEALTGSAERASALMRGSFEAAGATGGNLRGVADLVAQFRIAADRIGATDAEVVRFSESLIKLGTIGGASMAAIANGTRQLSQGLAGGILRAEEFNSVVENTPLIAKALADELAGGSLGALRQMVLDGRVLSDQVFAAILRQSGEIDANFAKLPRTMEQATNRLAASMTSFLASLDQSLGISQGIAAALERAAGFLDQLGTRAQANEIGGIVNGSRERMAADGWAFINQQAQPTPSVSASAASTGGGRGGGRSPAEEFADAQTRAFDGLADAIQRAGEELGRVGLKGEELARYDAIIEGARVETDLLTAAEKAKVDVSDEVLDRLAQQRARLEELAVATEAARAAQEAQTQAAENGRRAIEAVGNAITNGITQADSFADALRNVGVQLANIAIQGLFGAGPAGGFFNDLFGVAADGAAGALFNAKGNAFSGGRVVPFATGGVVNGPTVFPMAGGRTGLMGEAGPEAIMPLTRGPGGKLGVQATGETVIHVMLSPGLMAEVDSRAASTARVVVQQTAPGVISDAQRRQRPGF